MQTTNRSENEATATRPDPNLGKACTATNEGPKSLEEQITADAINWKCPRSLESELNK